MTPVDGSFCAAEDGYMEYDFVEAMMEELVLTNPQVRRPLSAASRHYNRNCLMEPTMLLRVGRLLAGSASNIISSNRAIDLSRQKDRARHARHAGVAIASRCTNRAPGSRAAMCVLSNEPKMRDERQLNLLVALLHALFKQVSPHEFGPSRDDLGQTKRPIELSTPSVVASNSPPLLVAYSSRERDAAHQPR